MGQILGPIGYLFNILFTYPIFNGLMLLYHVLGDFGLSIIVLTLVVKLLLFPLTLQQLKAMKATQALAPQIAEIKKKYGKDQQGQMQATQALYKEYGIRPLAGNCLPLLIQMPVLFGLFYALNTVVRGPFTLSSINALIYPFLPHFRNPPDIHLKWFAFISPALSFSLGAPDPTHILPILAALATFVQLRMSQANNPAAAGNDAMGQQMKLMQYISPAMVLFFGWNYAAGLALYWTVASLFAMVQQYFVTGWGSLLTTPSFLGGSSKDSSKSNRNASNNGYTANPAKETKILEETNVEDNGPVGSKLQTSAYRNGTSPARRRPRNSSASARRRTSNAPKRNVSRSRS